MALSFATIRFFAVIRQTIESSVAVALSTEVSETQERKGLRFSQSSLLPVSNDSQIAKLAVN